MSIVEMLMCTYVHAYIHTNVKYVLCVCAYIYVHTYWMLASITLTLLTAELLPVTHDIISCVCVACIAVVKLKDSPILCKTDEVGELVVQGLATGSSYFGLQGRTAQTFHVSPSHTRSLCLSLSFLSQLIHSSLPTTLFPFPPSLLLSPSILPPSFLAFVLII